MTDIATILSKPATTDAFHRFLASRGCEILRPSNEWELLRFRAARRVNVVYRDKRGQISPVGPDIEPATVAFTTAGPWRPEPAAERKIGSAKRRRWIATLLHRDGPDCFYCGLPLGEDVTLEDMLSITAGGKRCLANLALAHQPCNLKAGHLSVVEKVRLRERMRAALDEHASLLPIPTSKCDCQAPDVDGVRGVSMSCPIHNENPDLPDVGSPCPSVDCNGRLALVRDGDCSCHIFPPCRACVGAKLTCDACGHITE